MFDTVAVPNYGASSVRLAVLNEAKLMESAIDMAVEEFGRYVPPSSVKPTLRYADPSLSFGIIADGYLIGAYLVSVHSLKLRGPAFPSLERRPALQGEALVVDVLARGRGYGRLLRETLTEVGRIAGADYVWGGALEELQNLQCWLTRRVLIRSSAGIHITLEPIAADLKEGFLPLAGERLRERWMADLGIRIAAEGSDTQEWPTP
jgi:hypothetical protein